MEILLQHIRNTSGRATPAGCAHTARHVCVRCFQVAYCGQDCQSAHWAQNHQYECIGPPVKRAREDEEQLIDLSQLRDLWGIIQPWLSADDLKNLRLASREVEQHIRRAYFSRFRVRLTQVSFAQVGLELASFITAVDDSESGGTMALELSHAQKNNALKDVRIRNNSDIDWVSLTQLQQLEELNLSGNGLYEIPESIGQLVNLQRLSLFDNRLKFLPESIGNLRNLQILNLFYNQLKVLPESIGQLSNLRSLSVFWNHLTELPESIGQLSNLHKLYMSYNKLTELPDSIGQLVNLRKLYLKENSLTQLPESIGQLSNLRKLDISYNQLTEDAKERLFRQFGDVVIL
jgi:hypothetical protein